MHALLTTSFSAVFRMHIYCICVLRGMLIRLKISWENIHKFLTEEGKCLTEHGGG